MFPRVRYYGDFVTVPLMILGFTAATGFTARTGAYAAAGLFLWTLVEYAVHRAFHDAGGAPRKAHKPHHVKPSSIEAERSSLTTPLIVIPVAGVLVGSLGVGPGCATLVGLLIGYFAFIVVHHAAHRWIVYPTSPLYAATRRHALHHYRGPGNYGVITSFWDLVFRTHCN